jgi:DNA-binding beta-propeller fold protein YncE
VTRTAASLVAGWVVVQTVSVAAPATEAPKPRRYALVVGIGSYSNPDLPAVGGDKDADNLASALQKYGGVPASQMVVLKERGTKVRPDRDAIIEEAIALSRKASTDASILFAFSGHGFEEDDGQDYLVPLGVGTRERVNLRTGSLALRDLLDALQTGNPREVILLIDACRTSIESLSIARPFAVPPSSLTRNVAALFATGSGAPSQARPDGTGGFFLPAVSERMRIVYLQKSRVSFDEFARLVQEDVRAQTRNCPGCQEQTPTRVVVGPTPADFFMVDPAGQDPANLVTIAGSRVLISPDRSEIQLSDAATGQVTIYSRSRTPIQGADAALRERPSRSGSRVVADGPRGEVYVADEARSRVLLFANREVREPLAVPVPGGKPDLMVLRPSTRHLYVADSELHRVHVLDVAVGKIVGQFPQRFPIPTRITGLALSPDERFLYVGNQGGEGTGRLGSISIVDLQNGRFLDTDIGDVNCPEGMDFGADGQQLFVASQCGAGQDPLFFVDVQSQRTKALSGFAVGRSVATDTHHGKVYVARVGTYVRDANGNLVIVPAQLSSVDLMNRNRVFSIPLDVHSFAMTPGDRYLLAVGGQQLHVVNTETDEVVKSVFFDTPAAGVAVAAAADGRNAVCYVWLPDENRLFFAGVGGLTSPGNM